MERDKSLITLKDNASNATRFLFHEYKIINVL